MKRKIFIGLGIVILGIIGLMALWIGYMVSPTKGAKIAKYDNPHQALVIVDLQEDATGATATAPFPYKKAEEIITHVNRLIKEAQNRNMAVIVVDQEFSGFLGTMWSKVFVGRRFMKGEPGTKTDSRLLVQTAEKFLKPKGDAFSNPALDQYLVAHQVNELFVVGVDAEYCVYQTAKGALNRGYKVMVVKDAIGLLKEDKWGKILSKYKDNGISVIESSVF